MYRLKRIELYINNIKANANNVINMLRSEVQISSYLVRTIVLGHKERLREKRAKTVNDNITINFMLRDPKYCEDITLSTANIGTRETTLTL